MKIRLYAIDGVWWLGLMVGTTLHLITRKGRVGDCISP